MGILIQDATPQSVVDKPRTKKPPMYEVVLLNDDFTPMDFVVDILCQLFHKSESEATRIMLAVHHDGQGICGIFSFEIAESKTSLVRQTSRDHGHPLKCIMEKVEKHHGDEPC